MSKKVNLDVKHDADSHLVELGIELVSNGLGTEIEIYEGFIASLASGALSVRGVKATIDEINVVGALPSIAVTSVQYFEATEAVRQLDGGKEQPLVKVIGVATQGTRKLGKADFMAKVAEGGTYSKLAKHIENLPAKEKAEKAPKVEGIDGHLLALLGLLEAEDFDGIIKNIELAEKVLTRLGAQVKLSKQANHPSVRIAQAG